MKKGKGNLVASQPNVIIREKRELSREKSFSCEQVELFMKGEEGKISGAGPRSRNHCGGCFDL